MIAASIQTRYLHQIEVDGAHQLRGRGIGHLQAGEEQVIANAMGSMGVSEELLPDYPYRWPTILLTLCRGSRCSVRICAGRPGSSPGRDRADDSTDPWPFHCPDRCRSRLCRQFHTTWFLRGDIIS